MKSLIAIKLIVVLTSGASHVESFADRQDEASSHSAQQPTENLQDDTGVPNTGVPTDKTVEWKAEIDATAFMNSLETVLTKAIELIKTKAEMVQASETSGDSDGMSEGASSTERPLVETASQDVGTKSVGEQDFPSWVSEAEGGVTSKGDHTFLVVTIPHTDVASCTDDLADKLPSEVLTYIHKKILRHTSVESIPFLSADYIQREILNVNSDRTFTKTLVRPGGEMYQIYRQVTIPASHVTKILNYERDIVSGERSVRIGAGTAVLISMVGAMSGLLGLLSRREKSKGMA
ncbi:hypothetical protein SH449x_003718 [Pirellulaceae bacterium SH449]